MTEINDKLDLISGLTDHYLVRARTTGHNYFIEFLEAANILKSLMTAKEFEYWLTEKMLLKRQPFAEKTFIQYCGCNFYC